MSGNAGGAGTLVAYRFRLEDLLREQDGVRVWRAVDLTLARNVAIHVVPAADPRAQAAITAARTSALVTDGRILRVLDALEEPGPDGAVVHVVHEWGAGPSLAQVLAAEGPLEPRRSAALVQEVAEAICVAHAHGVAHGRLVPENVVLTDFGAVKLAGFVVDAVLHRPSDRPAPGGPGPGRGLGEHEQDVRNIGALLYAALTGRWPGSPGSSLPAAPEDHGRLCRPRQVRPGVPKALDVLCHRVLGELTPRYETATEVAGALAEYLGTATVGPVMPGSGPTAFLDVSSMSAPEPTGALGPAGGPGLGPATDPSAPQAPGTHDPGATQPGLPPALFGRRVGGAEQGVAGAAAEQPLLSGERTTPHPHRDPHRDPRRDRPGATWLRLAALLAAVLVVLLAVVLAYDLGSEGDPAPPVATPTDPGKETTTPPQQQVIEPASVSDFDPDQVGGRPSENPDLVPLATDGDPSTAWQTKTYFLDRPQLAPYKSGVGLLLDLAEAQKVGEVTVTFQGGPYDVALLAAPTGSAAPRSADGLDQLAVQSGVTGEVRLAPAEAVDARWLVVWLTAIPPADGGGFRGRVAEVVVRS